MFNRDEKKNCLQEWNTYSSYIIQEVNSTFSENIGPNHTLKECDMTKKYYSLHWI